MEKKQKKIGSLLITLRAVVVFVVLLGVLALIFWIGYDSYRDVAEWSEPGSRTTLVMDGKTYTLSGVIGKKGLTTKKYPLGELLGEVKDDGVDELLLPETDAPTEEPSETMPEDTEATTEAYEEVPDLILSLVEGYHAYLIYSVEKQDDFLLVLFPDGNYYLFYGEDVENPIAS